MPATRYFVEQVLRKRPYIMLADCEIVVGNPLKTETQADGRIRHWGHIVLPNETEPRILRVVTLEDGQTIHNAFPDRNFREEAP
jgi:hypothetical protein